MVTEVESLKLDYVLPLVLIVDPATQVSERVQCLSDVLARLSQEMSSKGVTAEPIIKVIVANSTPQTAAPYLLKPEVVFEMETKSDGFHLGRVLSGLVDDVTQEVSRQKMNGKVVLKPQLVVITVSDSGDGWENPLTEVFAAASQYRFGTLHFYFAESVKSQFVNRLGGCLSREQYVLGVVDSGERDSVPSKPVTSPDISTQTAVAMIPRWSSPELKPRRRLREYESRTSELVLVVTNMILLPWRLIESSVSSVMDAFDESVPVETPNDSPITKSTSPEPMAMSANGNPIIGEASSINKSPWWNSRWWNVGKDEVCREVEIDVGTAADLAIIGLTTRGQSHRYGGLPNQDSFAILHDDLVPGFLFVAVSDGVSNARFSGYASRKLVRCVVRDLHGRVRKRIQDSDSPPSDDELREMGSAAFWEASKALLSWNNFEVLAPSEGPDEIDSAEFSATLTVAIIPVGSSTDSNRHALVGFVGDSPCYILNDNTWQLVTPATKSGETLNNATAALPFIGEESGDATWLDVPIAPGSAFFLMTDGFGTSLSSGRSSVGVFLGAEWSRPRTIVDFLRTAEFDRAGEDDDRTVVAVWTPPFMSPLSIEESAPALTENI